MNSKKSIPSSKSLLSIDTKKLINLKCKNDHFGYQKQLSITKNHSSYSFAYKDIDKSKIVSNFETQKYKRTIAPASLDHALLKRSLHQSTIHFSQNKDSKLPSIQLESSYNRSFHTKNHQTLVKGKAKDGYFLKQKWHEDPLSNYKKSYNSPKIDLTNSLQIGKPQQDQIKVFKTPFKAQSNYDQSFTKTMQRSATLHVDSTDFIKSKDHLKGINFQLKGQSEYKSRFERINDKQNMPSQKSLSSKKKISLLPEINPVKRYQKQETQHLPKKSIKMKKTTSSPLQITSNKSQLHRKIPSNLFW